MNTRALPAAERLTALGVQPIATGHLLADCERWCRDQLPPRAVAVQRNGSALTSTGAPFRR